MRKLDFTPKFKKEMNDIELLGIEKILDNIGKYGSIDILDGVNHEQYGLAYTSSSRYAMYNVTGTVVIDFSGNKKIIHFAITENNMLIIVAEDENEDYHYYEIETSDFY